MVLWRLGGSYRKKTQKLLTENLITNVSHVFAFTPVAHSCYYRYIGGYYLLVSTFTKFGPYQFEAFFRFICPGLSDPY